MNDVSWRLTSIPAAQMKTGISSTIPDKMLKSGNVSPIEAIGEIEHFSNCFRSKEQNSLERDVSCSLSNRFSGRKSPFIHSFICTSLTRCSHTHAPNLVAHKCSMKLSFQLSFR